MLDIEEEMRKNPFWPYRVKAPKKKKERPEPAEPKERRKWSTEEDDLLRTAVSKHGETNWVAVSGDVATRDNVQCIQRWSRIKPGAIKGAWSEEEDALLVYLVGMGFPNWGKVAAQLPGRSPKQCRERWNHHLDPSINKTEFTPEEDEIICKKFEELGSKWSIISKSLPGRTDNSVRTRFQALKRRDSKSEPHDKIRKRAKSSRNAKDFHVVTALVDKGKAQQAGPAGGRFDALMTMYNAAPAVIEKPSTRSSSSEAPNAESEESKGNKNDNDDEPTDESAGKKRKLRGRK